MEINTPVRKTDNSTAYTYTSLVDDSSQIAQPGYCSSIYLSPVKESEVRKKLFSCCQKMGLVDDLSGRVSNTTQIEKPRKPQVISNLTLYCGYQEERGLKVAQFLDSGMEVDGRPNIGGMEKAFSKNVMMRLVAFFSGRLIVDMFWEARFRKREARPTRKQPRKRKKTCRRLGNGDGGVWDLLPNELLVSVLMKLSVIDYISFSGVCRSWRSTSIDIRKFFMERQQPLVVVRPRYSKKACILYNMFDGKSWKAMLPDLPCKKLVGLSCGYLITIDRNTGFWLVNLMTRHELRFPLLPESMDLRKSLALPESVGGILGFKIRAVLFRSTQLSRVFLVLFSRNHNLIRLSESGASIWQEYLLPNTSAGIAGVKILDGKIFVLTRDALFGEFNPRGIPVLKLYKIKIPIQPDKFTCVDLVTSDSKLYMIVSQYSPNSMTSIPCLSLYEIDYKLESVQPIHDLGSKSLFLSRCNSAVIDTSGWGAGNCVCVLKSMYLNRFSFFHLNGNELATAPVIWDGFLKPYFWYFPGESWDISSVGDEFGL